MSKLKNEQFLKMDSWVRLYARPYDRAKWDYLFGGGTKDNILTEMLKYQNKDGGFGSGFESDILLPDSAAIPSAEAIFQSYHYTLDCGAGWFSCLLSYFENTIQDIPCFWESVPKEVMDYPRAPWWNYSASDSFSPNPCAVVASALIAYGTPPQKELGTRIAQRCFEYLSGEDFCSEHDCYNLMTLVKKLLEVKSPLVTKTVISAIRRRIASNVCYDESRWGEYVSQPLDFADSPDSLWYEDVKDGIEKNLKYWLDTINPNGVWMPNFSWGEDSEVSRQVTENWKGYIAVKRARILRNYGLIE